MARCSAPLLAVARAYVSTLATADEPVRGERVSLWLQGTCLPLLAPVGCIAHGAAAGGGRAGGSRSVRLEATW